MVKAGEARLMLPDDLWFKGPVTIPAANYRGPQKQSGKFRAEVKAKLVIVLDDLHKRHKRGAAKPSTVEKLKNTMKSALKNGETETEMAVLIQALQDSGAISVSGGKVTYALPPRAL